MLIMETGIFRLMSTANIERLNADTQSIQNLLSDKEFTSSVDKRLKIHRRILPFNMAILVVAVVCSEGYSLNHRTLRYTHSAVSEDVWSFLSTRKSSQMSSRDILVLSSAWVLVSRRERNFSAISRPSLTILSSLL